MLDYQRARIRARLTDDLRAMRCSLPGRIAITGAPWGGITALGEATTASRPTRSISSGSTSALLALPRLLRQPGSHR